MTNEQKIKEACIKANNDIAGVCYDCGHLNDGENCITGGTHVLPRPIHLADVLLAIQELEPEQRPMYFNVGCDGGFYEVKYTYPDGNKCVIEHHGLRMGAGWNLRKDSLSDQSEQTKQFLAELLDKE